jgi:hypothetical protein
VSAGPATFSAYPALATIPEHLRKPLLAAFDEIVTNYRQGRWEPSELNGGKLCEILYTILQGHVDGAYPAKPAKPSNMVDACRSLEKASSTFPRSVRIQIPRMLIALYEIRNNRGVGHVGGDVDPNHMDAVAVLYVTKWIVSELVRVFHGVDTSTATAVVDALIEREIPIIWDVGGMKRILSKSLSRKNKTLLLLYGQATAVDEEVLADWVEHPRLSDYRKDVLRPLHEAKLVEYDRGAGIVHLSPLGMVYVEERLPLNADRAAA